MSGLAALLAGHTPPAVYQWHNAASVADVQHAVEHARWGFKYVDGWTIEDRESFLKATCACMELPDDTHDVQGLAQCLMDVDGGDHGLVLLWDGWSPLARHDEDTFRQVLDAFRKRASTTDHGKFTVILRGEGPDLELDELPIKH